MSVVAQAAFRSAEVTVSPALIPDVILASSEPTASTLTSMLVETRS
ncbi:hypothetical protein RCH23_003408 [Cryobacterium sp. CAN_C3]|nr:hypothetical protein [Cryobacterium sp. CAN_C3]